MSSQYLWLSTLAAALWMSLSSLYAQYSAPYSTSSVQGSTIITNYYDPNATFDAGPGLPPTPLQSRFTGPLQQSINGSDSMQSTNYPIWPNYPISRNYPISPVFNSTTTALDPYGQPAVTFSANSPLSGASTPSPSFQPIQYQQSPYQQPQPRRGPQILNPLPGRFEEQPPSHYEDPVYPYPGLLTQINGRWVGSEYLYDIPRDISILVEVVKPAQLEIAIDVDRLKEEARSIFTRSYINPQSLAIGEAPPLPFFHLLIFAYPDGDTHVAAVIGRLFEQVKWARLDFDNLPGTSQAITWEKINLLIASKSQFPDQLATTVKQIVTNFVDCLRYYDNQKLHQESGFKLEPAIEKKALKKSHFRAGSRCMPH